MAKLTKRSAIGIAQEATQGTYVAPAVASDFIYVENLNFDIVPEKIERDYHRTFIDQIPHMIGKKMVNINFSTEVHGGGGVAGGSISSNYQPLSALLVACGLTGVTHVAAQTSFLPSSTATGTTYYGPGKSVSMIIYRDGVSHGVTGAMGTFKISAEAGKKAMFDFSFKGLINTDNILDATMPSITVNPTLPPVVQSGALAVNVGGAWSPIAGKLDFDAGVEVTERPDISSPDGIKGFQVTSFKPTMSINPEAVTISTYSAFTKLAAGTTGSLTAVIGTVAGNKVEIYCPAIQHEDVNYGDNNGILLYELPLRINASPSGNDSFYITFK